MQKFKRAGKLNWIKAFNKAGTHSSKPEEFYELVREMSPEPRIDIFARRNINGFDSWGDEIESNINLRDIIKQSQEGKEEWNN